MTGRRDEERVDGPDVYDLAADEPRYAADPTDPRAHPDGAGDDVRAGRASTMSPQGWIALGAVAVAVLTVVLVWRADRGPDGRLADGASPSPVARTTASLLAHAPGLAAQQIPGAGSIADVAVGGSGVIFLQHGPDRLSQAMAADRDRTLIERVDAPVGSIRLALDGNDEVLWILAPNNTDVTSLRRIELGDSGRLDAGAPVDIGLAGTAGTLVSVDGTAWVTTRGRLTAVEHASDTTARTPFDVGAIVSLVADPARHRALFTTVTAGSTGLWAATIAMTGRPIVEQLATVPHPTTSMAVGPDRIWLTALDGSLLGLDPLSAEPVGSARRTSGILVAAGTDVLWQQTDTGLDCRSNVDGSLLEHFTGVTAPVASRRGESYAVVDGTLARLSTSGRCPG